MLKKVEHIFLLVLLFILVFATNLQGQPREYSVKAALIEKFTHYIEWPSGNEESGNKEYFIVGLYGDSELGVAVSQVFGNLIVNEKDVSIVHVDKNTDLSTVDLLIVGEISQNVFSEFQSIVSDKPVLTISDNNVFWNSQIHILLFITDEGNVKFRINKKAFDNSGLYISHHLLKYAEVINQ